MKKVSRAPDTKPEKERCQKMLKEKMKNPQTMFKDACRTSNWIKRTKLSFFLMDANGEVCDK